MDCSDLVANGSNMGRLCVGLLFSSRSWTGVEVEMPISLHDHVGMEAIVDWEVLNGVGVDGVGGIFLFFPSLFFFFFVYL